MPHLQGAYRYQRRTSDHDLARATSDHCRHPQITAHNTAHTQASRIGLDYGSNLPEKPQTTAFRTPASRSRATFFPTSPRMLPPRHVAPRQIAHCCLRGSQAAPRKALPPGRQI